MARRDPAAAARARALSLVRTQQPFVIWGAEPMNGGNYLYLWATAWARQRHTGERWLVRHKPKMDPWLQEFPLLQALTVDEADVGWRQRRTVEWGQQAGQDFRFKDLRDFARELLLASESFRSRMAARPDGVVVVNVRRGDYYADAGLRAVFGFDIPGYVHAALRRIPAERQERVLVVSDDPGWCAAHLGFLGKGRSVDFMPTPHDMFEDLAQLAVARDLILGNSTFSYWGGYLATARSAWERPRTVFAPLHFNRLYSDGESPLLLPEWTAIPDDEFSMPDRIQEEA